MSDLVEFLRARLGEDEQVALGGDRESPDMTYRLDERLCWVSVTPARVLREVEAKRQTIERCLRAEIGDSGDFGAITLAENVLADLALPYADHPDYREEWRA
jgi:hypothetical protein